MTKLRSENIQQKVKYLIKYLSSCEDEDSIWSQWSTL